MKKFIVFANTMKKIIVFRKHYEKNNSVFGKRPNISSALYSGFLRSCKKKLIEGPGPRKIIDLKVFVKIKS